MNTSSTTTDAEARLAKLLDKELGSSDWCAELQNPDWTNRSWPWKWEANVMPEVQEILPFLSLETRMAVCLRAHDLAGRADVD